MRWIAIVLLFVSINSYAGMWRLVQSEFVGNGWFCTYRLEGSGYISTVFSKGVCQNYIYQQ